MDREKVIRAIDGCINIDNYCNGQCSFKLDDCHCNTERR